MKNLSFSFYCWTWMQCQRWRFGCRGYRGKLIHRLIFVFFLFIFSLTRPAVRISLLFFLNLILEIFLIQVYPRSADLTVLLLWFYLYLIFFLLTIPIVHLLYATIIAKVGASNIVKFSIFCLFYFQKPLIQQQVHSGQEEPASRYCTNADSCQTTFVLANQMDIL